MCGRHESFQHLLGSARSLWVYLTWLCDCHDLPWPGYLHLAEAINAFQTRDHAALGSKFIGKVRNYLGVYDFAGEVLSGTATDSLLSKVVCRRTDRRDPCCCPPEPKSAT